MLMEWLEPKIKIRINETQVEFDNTTKELYSRFSKLIHETIVLLPSHSNQAMELDELVNELIEISIDSTYRIGFGDCYKFLTSHN